MSHYFRSTPLLLPTTNNKPSTLLKQLISKEDSNSLYLYPPTILNDEQSLLDVYKIKQKLGEGSFGQVYLTKIKSTKERLALKRIVSNFNGDETEDEIEKVINENLQEFNTLIDLKDHPSIVKVKDVFLMKDKASPIGNVSYSMRLYEHGSLLGWIDKRKRNDNVMNYRTLKSIMIQLCLVLKFIHGKGLLHRDIKPANIFIDYLNSEKSFLPEEYRFENGAASNDDSSLVVILGDFGTVRKYNEGSMVQTTVGSQMYMSPEILYGETYQADADVWSLGATLFEIATFKAKPIAMMLYKREGATIRKNLEESLLTDNEFVKTEEESKECLELINLLMDMFTLEVSKRPTIDSLLSSPCLTPHLDRILLLVSQYNSQMIREENELLIKLVEDLKYSASSAQGLKTMMKKSLATTNSGSSTNKEKGQKDSGNLLLVASWWSSNLRIFPIGSSSPSSAASQTGSQSEQSTTNSSLEISNVPYLLDLKSDITCEQMLPISDREVILGLQSGEIVKIRREGSHSFKEISRLSAHKDRIKCLKVFNDQYFASGAYNKVVKIWNVSNLECVQTFNHDSGHVFALATTQRNSSTQEVGSSLFSVGADMSIYEWDLEKLLQKREKAHTDEIYSCLYNQNNSILLTGSFKELRGWDRRQYNPIISFSPHSSYINKIVEIEKSYDSHEFRDGNCFMTCSNDGTVKLWDIRKLMPSSSNTSSTDQQQLELKSFKVNLDAIKTLHFNSANNVVFYGTKRGRMGTLDLKSFTPIKSYNAIKGVVGVVDVSSIQML